MVFATIPEALEEIRAGRMLVVVDDEDRENEGDLTGFSFGLILWLTRIP